MLCHPKTLFPDFSEIKQAATDVTQKIVFQFSIKNFQFGLKKSYDVFNNVRDSHIFRIFENGLINALGSNKLINLISHTTSKPLKACKYMLNSLVFSISSLGTYKIHLSHKELCQHAESLLLKAEDIFFMVDEAFIHENKLLKAAGYENLSITVPRDNELFYPFTQQEFFGDQKDASAAIIENAFFDATLKTLSIADLLPIFMPNSLLIIHLPLTAMIFAGLLIASYQKYTSEYNQAQYLKCLRHKILITQEKILALQSQFGTNTQQPTSINPISTEDIPVTTYISSKQFLHLQNRFLTFLPYLNASASGASMTAGVKKLLETLQLQNIYLKHASLLSTFIGVTLQSYRSAKSDEDFRQLLNEFAIVLNNLDKTLKQAKNILFDEQNYVLHIDNTDHENTDCDLTVLTPTPDLDEDELLKYIETTMEESSARRNVSDYQNPIPTFEEHDTMRFFSGKKASPSYTEESPRCKKFK